MRRRHAIISDARVGVISREQMLALQPHPGWADGREGYLFCRFDAIIDPARHLRAELTWYDDSEEVDSSAATCYFNAELLLQSNDAEYHTLDDRVIRLSLTEALALVHGDPVEILANYALTIRLLTLSS